MSKKANRESTSVSWGDRILIVLLIVVLLSSMAFAAVITSAETIQPAAAEVYEMVEGPGACYGFHTFCTDVSWNS